MTSRKVRTQGDGASTDSRPQRVDAHVHPDNEDSRETSASRSRSILTCRRRSKTGTPWKPPPCGAVLARMNRRLDRGDIKDLGDVMDTGEIAVVALPTPTA